MTSVSFAEPKLSEHQLQNQIIELLEYRGGVPIRINSGMTIIHGSDGKSRAIKHAGKGTSDIVALYKGFFLAIEVKVGKNKPTFEQREFTQRVNGAGGVGVTIWDLDSIIAVLDNLDQKREGK